MLTTGKKTVDTEIRCAHCSEVCDDDSIRADDKNFCCLGCIK